MAKETAAGHSVAADLSEGVWMFDFADPAGAGAVGFDDSNWQRVSIPHTWNALDAQDGKPRVSEQRPAGYRLGVGWYRRTLPIPEDYAEQRTFLRFEGASVVTDVYVNGAFAGTHKGAFGAFCFEITDFVTPGEEALIAVRVDNTRRQGRDYRDAPLPFHLKQLDIAPLKGDFNLYGGIYRGVELLTKPAVGISPLHFASPGIYVTQPRVSVEKARLVAEVVVDARTPGGEATLSAVLKGADGQIAASVEQTFPIGAENRQTVEISVDEPRLWNGTEDPYRYTLEVTVQKNGGEPDTVVQKIGLRSLEYDAKRGFVLNGKPIRLRGVNRHQDWQDRGWAITGAHHDADFAMIQEIGANAVRLAHYPQDEYVLELCDRMGFITFIEIPWVGLTHDSEAFRENLRMQLKEMICQHFNRAGIPMWGLWNELAHAEGDIPPDPLPLLKELHQLAHEIDPARPTIAAASNGSDRVEGLRDATDLIAWNLYPGWYDDTRPEQMADEIEERLARDGRSMIGISEYGAGASIYQHVDWSALEKPEASHSWHPEEWQAHFHEVTWDAIAAADRVWGSFVWNMFDFAADHRNEGDREGINDKGLVTHDRSVKKDAFYFYKATWSDEPLVHITSRRYSPRPAGDTTVRVYSNASEVELFVNGQSQGPGSRNGVVHTWPELELASGVTEVRARATTDIGTVEDRVTWEAIEEGQTM